jgi:hypothetical protein
MGILGGHNMGGAIGEMFMAAIGGVVSFICVREVINGQNTTGWSTLEITLFGTLVPLLVAIGVIFGIFAAMKKFGK